MALTAQQRVKFEELALFCVKYSDLIPLNFILAFYVAQVVTRWWSQWNVIGNKYSQSQHNNLVLKAVPWPDEVVNMMSVFCPGDDNNSRLIRRTVVR